MVHFYLFFKRKFKSENTCDNKINKEIFFLQLCHKSESAKNSNKTYEHCSVEIVQPFIQKNQMIYIIL